MSTALAPKMMQALPAKRCRFFHRWRLHKDTGANQYFECRKCAGRKVVSKPGIYQPIDSDWVLQGISVKTRRNIQA